MSRVRDVPVEVSGRPRTFRLIAFGFLIGAAVHTTEIAATFLRRQ